MPQIYVRFVNRKWTLWLHLFQYKLREVYSWIIPIHITTSIRQWQSKSRTLMLPNGGRWQILSDGKFSWQQVYVNICLFKRNANCHLQTFMKIVVFTNLNKLINNTYKLYKIQEKVLKCILSLSVPESIMFSKKTEFS